MKFSFMRINKHDMMADSAKRFKDKARKTMNLLREDPKSDLYRRYLNVFFVVLKNTVSVSRSCHTGTESDLDRRLGKLKLREGNKKHYATRKAIEARSCYPWSNKRVAKWKREREEKTKRERDEKQKRRRKEKRTFKHLHSRDPISNTITRKQVHQLVSMWNTTTTRVVRVRRTNTTV